MAKTVVLQRKPLSLSERTYLPQIVTGLKTTFSNMFKEKVTLQYPEEKPIIPKNYRGVPTLVKDPNGRKSVFLASYVNLSAHLKRFVSPPVQFQRVMMIVSMLKKPLKNLKLICSVVSIVDTAKKFVLKKPFFCKMSILPLDTHARR